MSPNRSSTLHAGPMRVARRALLLTLAGVASLALVGVRPALAAEAPSPWWWVGSEVSPTNLPPEGEGEIIVMASNLGDGTAIGSGGHPIVITDKLPPQLTATQINGQTKHGITTSCSLATLRCMYPGTLYPYERLAITIKVKVGEPDGTVTTLPNEVSAEGGGAAHPASSVQHVRIDGTPPPFGVQEGGYELAPYDQDGTPATQAGSHPFELTSTLVMNQAGTSVNREPVALPRNLRFQLPLGLIGDPGATEQCSATDFAAHAPRSEVNQCPPGSVVGVVSVTINEPVNLHVITLDVPLFNLVPSEGEPARFGFEALGLVPIVIDTAVGPGGGYGVVARVTNASQLTGLLSTQVTFWGLPGDPSHDQSRGWECVQGGVHYEKGEVSTPCPISTSLPETPLLTLPTSCAVNPAIEHTSSSVEAESWEQQGYVKPPSYVWSGPLEEPLGFAGCEALLFEPSIAVSAQTHAASTPTGLSVDVKVPQDTTIEPNPEGRAEADVRDATVTLPAGVQVNPSAANGLQVCAEHGREVAPGVIAGGIGFTGFEDFQPGSPTPVFTDGFDFTPPQEPKSGESFCPDASKIGVVHIRTPLLPKELEGGVYLAEPAPNGEAGKNPFDSLVALYIVAEDKEAGVLVKLTGEGKLDQSTGQITTSFLNTPQLPFEELKVELLPGQRASLSTPAHCGEYATQASFTPWSETGPVAVSSPAGEFDVSEDCGSSPLAFAPSFTAQSLDTSAGAFTSFSLRLERLDGEQALTGLSVSLPAGIAALLSTVTPCVEPPAGQPWACGAESLIGHSLASSGVGSEPVTLPGNVYLTVGYEGAPFGILDETDAKAGPFDLGEVYVRSKVEVNPETAAVTIVTVPGPHNDGLPTILKGVPVQLKQLTVSVDRAGFEFNPTSCDAMSITGTLDGSEGAHMGVSSPFQVGGCANLPFHPALEASTQGQASKTDGASLDVKVTSQGLGVANIKKVDLALPKALPSRLTTLQKACPAAVFEANPAGCDEGSVIGYATIHTPVFKNPLAGPAYLVSHGGAAFPDVEFVLQGEGVKILLDGKTDIKEGITYSRFESAPDAPFTTFETVLPAGPHSALTANVAESNDFDLCGEKLEMPTTITGQNGAVIEQSTNIAIKGCAAVKSSKVKKLSLAQRLKQALAQCRKRYRHSKSKRERCERSAHAHYVKLALTACRKQVRHVNRKKCEKEARAKYGPVRKKAVRKK